MTAPDKIPGTLKRRVRRRNPFAVTSIPPLARCYAWPMNRWRESRGRQILFGAPHLLLYSVWRQMPPVGVTGAATLQTQKGPRTFKFDARNSQFQALYLVEFQAGYEPEVAATLDILLEDDAVFLDIGSNFGYFSALVASRPGFGGRVFAFEPFDSSFRDLNRLIQQTELGEFITPQQIALSDREGTARMRLPDHIHSGLATMDADSANPNPGGVRMTTLDSLDLGDPQVMKIDAEGAEVGILRGATKTLEKSRPYILFENMRDLVHPERTLAPMRLLNAAGYQFFQPVWQRKLDSLGFLLPTDGNHNAQPEEILVLEPLTVENRFLRQDQVNLLAVHDARLNELVRLFEAPPPTTA